MRIVPQGPAVTRLGSELHQLAHPSHPPGPGDIGAEGAGWGALTIHKVATWTLAPLCFASYGEHVNIASAGIHMDRKRPRLGLKLG